MSALTAKVEGEAVLKDQLRGLQEQCGTLKDELDQQKSFNEMLQVCVRVHVQNRDGKRLQRERVLKSPCLGWGSGPLLGGPEPPGPCGTLPTSFVVGSTLQTARVWDWRSVRPASTGRGVDARSCNRGRLDRHSALPHNSAPPPQLTPPAKQVTATTGHWLWHTVTNPPPS